jgi:UDP-N-acetylmuramoyl-tripeptide--D-alanyl-D-alanine ligase
MNRLCVFLVLASAGCLALAGPDEVPPPHRARLQLCGPQLDREVLEESLRLGQAFLIANQKPAGNFQYEYDWRTRRDTKADNQVRQAGALWGLATIFHHTGDEQARKAVERGLGFFALHSRSLPDGRRFLSYRGDGAGRVGGTALTALAHMDYLARARADLAPERLQALQAAIDGYLSFLIHARRENGRWYSLYDRDTGEIDESAPSTSYFDGEALLALVKAARYHGRDDLRAPALEAAEAGYRINVREALRLDPDSDSTKGYYQWASMAFFEIADSGWEGSEPYAARVLELADWMIGVHRTLQRPRNTGYAYEGIIHAFELARRLGDAGRRDRYACVIATGMSKLTSWQVGSSIANEYVAASPPDDTRSRGGVQNSASSSKLRIDVAQHQMHAVLLALRYVY